MDERRIVYGHFIRKDGAWIWVDDGTLNALQKEVDNLRGHIRRLERSNQVLEEENHRLKGQGRGWNETSKSR